MVGDGVGDTLGVTDAPVAEGVAPGVVHATATNVVHATATKTNATDTSQRGHRLRVRVGLTIGRDLQPERSLPRPLRINVPNGSEMGSA